MGSDSATVFRTRRQDVVALWEKWQRDNRAWLRKVRRATKELGVPDTVAMLREGYPCRMVGLGLVDGRGRNQQQRFWPRDREVPVGWRVEPKERFLVPALKTPEGRRIRKLLDDVGTLDDPRHDLPGMPTIHFSGLSLVHPRVEILNGHMYVYWPGSAPDDAIDREVWQLVKLSTYWKAKEAS